MYPLSPYFAGIRRPGSGFIFTVVTRGGVMIHIRPIRPDDAPLLVDFHAGLSDRTLYFRFCHHLRCLPPDMLKRFTDIDPRREVALLALDAQRPRERLLAVARSSANVGKEESELAIVVADHWQGKGVGASLFELCMKVTLNKGFRHLSAYILPENRVMRAMARKLGWKCASVADYYFTYEKAVGGVTQPARGEPGYRAAMPAAR